MVNVTRLLTPDDVERYVARALADAGGVIGRHHAAWHILRADDHMPALVYVKHLVISLDDLYQLCNWLLTAGIRHGVLVYAQGDMPPDIISAARAMGITVLDQLLVEKIMRQIVEATP